MPILNVPYTVQGLSDKTSVAASVRFAQDGKIHWPGSVAVASVSDQSGSAADLKPSAPNAATDGALWSIDL